MLLCFMVCMQSRFCLCISDGMSARRNWKDTYEKEYLCLYECNRRNAFNMRNESREQNLTREIFVQVSQYPPQSASSFLGDREDEEWRKRSRTQQVFFHFNLTLYGFLILLRPSLPPSLPLTCLLFTFLPALLLFFICFISCSSISSLPHQFSFTSTSLYMVSSSSSVLPSLPLSLTHSRLPPFPPYLYPLTCLTPFPYQFYLFFIFNFIHLHVLLIISHFFFLIQSFTCLTIIHSPFFFLLFFHHFISSTLQFSLFYSILTPSHWTFHNHSFSSFSILLPPIPFITLFSLLLPSTDHFLHLPPPPIPPSLYSYLLLSYSPPFPHIGHIKTIQQFLASSSYSLYYFPPIISSSYSPIPSLLTPFIIFPPILSLSHTGHIKTISQFNLSMLVGGGGGTGSDFYRHTFGFYCYPRALSPTRTLLLFFSIKTRPSNGGSSFLKYSNAW